MSVAINPIAVVYLIGINYEKLVAWCSGNAFDPINEVTVRRARLTL